MNAKNEITKGRCETLNMTFVEDQYPHLHTFLNTCNPKDFASIGFLEQGLGAYKTDEYSKPLDLISICCMMGKLEQLNYLLTLEEGKLWLAHFCMEAFLLASEQGHLQIIERLLEFAGVKEQMESDGRVYKAMRLAVIHGHQPIADFLLNKLDFIKDFKNYLKTFVLLAIENGHKEMVSWLMSVNSLKKSSPDVVRMLDSAARANQQAMFEFLLELPEVNSTLVPKYCSDTLFAAVESGNLTFITYVLQRSGLKDFDSINAQQASKLLGKNSKKDILELFLKFPGIRLWFIENAQWAIKQAIANGDQSILDMLLRIFGKRENAGKELVLALATLQNGPEQIAMVLYILDVQDVREALLRNEKALFSLIGNCNVKDIQHLLSRHQWIKLDFSFCGNQLLHNAIKRGDKTQFSLLMNYPEVVKQLLHGEITALCLAARHGQKDIVKLLCDYPVLRKKITFNNNEILREAVVSGNDELVMSLLDYPEVRENCCVNDNEILRKALSGNHRYLALNLLDFPEINYYAQFQVSVKGIAGLLSLYVGKELLALKRKKLVFESKHANSIFYIEPKKVPQYLLMIRYLIMLNTKEANQNIRFLFDIPSIQKVIHHSSEGGEPDNELLRLALKLGNKEAVLILLDSPSVCMLAKQHNYHVSEIGSDLNLEEVLEDNESARKRLSRTEELRLNEIRQKYADKIRKEGGEQQIFGGFIKYLEKIYAQDPATAVVGGNTISLPLNYQEFEKMRFSTEEEKKRALVGYYQHTVHTCWRFLQKPNPWIHPKAAFVVPMEKSNLRHASFESYIPMLAWLWMAASDTSVGIVDGCSPQKRMDLFILDIALIGRTHNWDKYQETQNKIGKRSVRYFDDMEADRPSCHSGIGRRAFEALKFYPTSQSNNLSSNIISEELREFVRDFYQNMPIFTQKAKQINDDVESIIYDDEEPSQLLLNLNISEKDQMMFIFGLCKKYGHDIINHTRWIEKQFEPFKSDSHVCMFYNYNKDILQRQIHADALRELRENINLAILGTKQVSDPETATPMEGVDSYLQWMSENATGTRGITRFNHWYHGDSGKIRARKLLVIANDPQSTWEDIQRAVSEVYAHSSHARHSLRNYLKHCKVGNEPVKELEMEMEMDGDCCNCF